MMSLNGNLIEYLSEFLEVREVVLGLAHTCSFLHRTLHLKSVLSRLGDRCLGTRNIAANALLRLLILVSCRPETLLQFRGVHTTGGVYQNRERYKLQNMFDYSGSAYTTSNHTSNVTTVALLTSSLPKPFFEDSHEDLEWFNVGLDLPQKYRDMPLLDDVLLTKARQPTRRVSEVEYRRPMDMLWIVGTVGEVRFQDCGEAEPVVGVVNRVAVGRPALATCPVKTLLITTSTCISLSDLSPYFDLLDYPSIVSHPHLRSTIQRHRVLKDYEFVEFTGSAGPLVWVQFSQYDLLQVEILLTHRRTVRQMQVLLLDREDRTGDYGTRDQGIDINYVVFTGWKFSLQELGS